MLIFYRIALYLALPVVLFRLALRSARSSGYAERLPQRFGYDLRFPADEERRKGYWIHAVSVGEVNAAVPLIKSLQADFPEKNITVTTMTPTGSDRVKKDFGDNVHHCYLPYDYPGAAKRFLDKIDPSVTVIMETEIWPNFISECRARNIPICYANVRMSDKSFKGYLRFKKLISPVLRKVSHFAVQSRADADRIIRLGADGRHVSVTGSIKFEIDVPASVHEAAQSICRNIYRNRPVFLAGSTREGEEAQVIEAFLEAKKVIKNLLLVLVPRHPERFSAVHKLCAHLNCSSVLRTQSGGPLAKKVDIYIGDTMGELSLLIASSDIAYIGGSLVPAGGHNLLEVCAAGVPVVFGSSMFNFQEISDLVMEKEAGIQIHNPKELADVVVKLINDPILKDRYGSNGRELVKKNKGALRKIRKIMDALPAN